MGKLDEDYLHDKSYLRQIIADNLNAKPKLVEAGPFIQALAVLALSDSIDRLAEVFERRTTESTADGRALCRSRWTGGCPE